jgi:hypothetical protein
VNATQPDAALGLVAVALPSDGAKNQVKLILFHCLLGA